ncbi:(S)-benzoin forming benzil reductase [Bacillus kexueae]|uniref:(S)-benzoin forming benzil reductase n=1 Tax=Aeribacillus kexueae TaxID=2078952 RepID=UPI001FAF4F49|nr:(S)-benzoin forming benzil reductase [Bacillus kexueae]
MNYYIITGISKGLGEALVREVMKTDAVIIGISRNENKALKEEAKKYNTPYHFVEGDLAKVDMLNALFQRVIEKVDLASASSITFIQNAGVVEPIKRVGKMDEEQLTTSVHVNYLAPMMLANAFANWTQSFNGKKTVVHVTSGAANRPMHGWSAYGSTKAGLDLFTKSFALEQENEENPIQVIGFSPGIMDTSMQETIRSSDQENFQALETFKSYYKEGQLRSPQIVAEKLMELLKSQIISGEIYHIRELL